MPDHVCAHREGRGRSYFDHYQCRAFALETFVAAAFTDAAPVGMRRMAVNHFTEEPERDRCPAESEHAMTVVILGFKARAKLGCKQFAVTPVACGRRASSRVK